MVLLYQLLDLVDKNDFLVFISIKLNQKWLS